MSITVRVRGVTPAAAGDAAAAVDGARTVAEAVGLLRLPLRTAVIILLNGHLAGWETVVQDGDAIELLPAIGGG